MFLIDCPKCAADDSVGVSRQLVSNNHIKSIHRTSEGLIGYVRCANGHTIIHSFAAPYPAPKPPASVLALRAESNNTRAA